MEFLYGPIPALTLIFIIGVYMIVRLKKLGRETGIN